VLKLVEGTLAPVSCRQEDACPRQDQCAALPLWERLDAIVDNFLESVTLADVLSGNIPV
jgi:DNA-binding IscR family transcriptional regulator